MNTIRSINTIRLSRIAALAGVSLVAVLGAGTTTASSAPTSPTSARAEVNIVRTAASAGQFTTLLKLAKRAGLVGALSGPGSLTVFAPTDAAFAKVPKKTLDALMQDKAKLRKVLLYHVVAGEVKAKRVVTLKSAKTLAKQPIRIGTRNGVVRLNGTVQVAKTDIAASNGVIHVINGVLIPPTL